MNMNNDYNKMYESFNQANEERKRENFNAFMFGLEKGLVKDLDEIYASGDMDKYTHLSNNIKSKGIRIFRNSAGKHKIKFNT